MTGRFDLDRAMRRLGAWTLEMLSEAVGTSAVLCLLTLVEDHRKGLLLPGDGPHLFAAVPIGSLMVLIAFGFTLYLLSTCIAGLTMRELSPWAYPAITALLYLGHSTLFFVWTGGRVTDDHHIAIQLSGAFIAFWCARAGNALVQRLDETSRLVQA